VRLLLLVAVVALFAIVLAIVVANDTSFEQAERPKAVAARTDVALA
jgi:hypothetical protein